MNKELTSNQVEELLKKLQHRFEKNPARHNGLEWSEVRDRLTAHPEKLWSLQAMEDSDGEPDVVSLDQASGEYIFYDCAPETPEQRRNLCYDREALDSRKEHKPRDSALDMASAMGIEILTELEYRFLQELGNFDTKTSSWLFTPPAIRKLGGAIFGDRRYGQVFVYHNGASSYYGVRGFRGSLRV